MPSRAARSSGTRGAGPFQRDLRLDQARKIGNEDAAHSGAEDVAFQIHELTPPGLLFLVRKPALDDYRADQDLERDRGEVRQELDVRQVFEPQEKPGQRKQTESRERDVALPRCLGMAGAWPQ